MRKSPINAKKQHSEYFAIVRETLSFIFIIPVYWYISFFHWISLSFWDSYTQTSLLLHVFCIGITQTAQFYQFLSCNERLHEIMVRALYCWNKIFTYKNILLYYKYHQFEIKLSNSGTTGDSTFWLYWQAEKISGECIHIICWPIPGR